jgi:hypothetical protein
VDTYAVIAAWVAFQIVHVGLEIKKDARIAIILAFLASIIVCPEEVQYALFTLLSVSELTIVVVKLVEDNEDRLFRISERIL